MLGKNVRVRVTKPYNYFDKKTNTRYRLNYGYAEIKSDKKEFIYPAVVIGINHPVNIFEGRVVAVVRHHSGRSKPNYVVVAPKKSRYINFQIEDSVKFLEKNSEHTLECLYENSSGAVVFRNENGARLYLLIKNKRSSAWGFPKGHMERSETEIATAKREVLEETGLHIRIFDGFKLSSEYKIGGRIEKRVSIFLSVTNDRKTVIQKEEIDDYTWLPFNKAYDTLKFQNDKEILKSAEDFLQNNPNQKLIN